MPSPVSPAQNQPSTEYPGLADLQALNAKLLVAQATSKGRAYSNNQEAGFAYTAPATLCILAGYNVARGSGIFRAGISFSWVDSAATDTITWNIVSFTSSTLPAQSGTQIGTGWYVAATATTGNPPLSSANSVVQFQGKQNVSASFPTIDGDFAWTGVIGAVSGSTLGLAGFTLGNNVALALFVNATNSITLSSISAWLEEEPF